MKVTCESCYFAFDLDDAKIPPSGVTATCPVCMQKFKVQKGGAAEAVETAQTKKLELELSPIDEDFSAAATASPPAPKPTPPPVAELDELDEIELPGMIEEKPQLPEPKPTAPSRWEALKKPAPPPTKPLPALKIAPTPPTPAPPPVATVPELASMDDEFGIGLDEPDSDDLPTPIDPNRRADTPELPTAATPKPLRPPLAMPVPPSSTKGAKDTKDTAELPEAIDGRRPGAELPTPKVAGAELPVARDGRPELPVAKDGRSELPVAVDGRHDLLTPKTDIDGVVARQSETGVQPKEVELPQPIDTPAGTTAPKSTAAAPTADGTMASPSVATPFPSELTTPAAPRRRNLLLAGGLLAVALVGSGAWFLFLTEAGHALLGGGGGGNETTLNAARKQIAEDTLPSYRRAVSSIKAHMEQHGETGELLGLEAQAHLAAARLGVTAEAKAADSVFAKLELRKNAAQESIEVRRALALRKLVAKQLPEAQAAIGEILAAAPADSTTLVYKGWLELHTGDAAIAAATLKKAVDAESTRAAALYALGRAKELLGEPNDARLMYQRALVRSPQHFRAELGLLRVGLPDGGRTTYATIEALIGKRLDSAAPRELAEAWATAGLLARDDGRRDVAEDRLRKAVGLDADLAIAQRELARVLLQQRRPKEALIPAKRALELQPKSQDARLMLFAAHVEAGEVAPAHAALQPLLPDAGKLPVVQYYQGRLALVGDKPDREKALELLTAAIAGDSKLLEAALWKSQTLQKLGRADEAIATLKAAETAAAADLALTLELGDAYRELDRPVDAEARYRAVLDKQPDDARARMGLAVALESQDKLELAKAELDKLRSGGAKVPGLNERLARIFKREGKLEDASTLFEAAMQEAAPSAALRLEVAELALQLKNLDRAQALADSVAREDDRGPRSHLLLARVALARNRLDDALMSARRSAVLGDLPESHFVLGQVLEAMSKYDQAVTEYALARRPPIEADASLGRARIMARLGATRDALDELQPLVKIPRLRAAAMLLMGDCYADQQQRDKAKKAYEDAAKADRNSADAAFKYGRALIDGGKGAPGIDELNRALKLAGDKAPFAAEAYLLLGDQHRDRKSTAAALDAYRKYLAVAPMASPTRVEVQRQIKLLGGTP